MSILKYIGSFFLLYIGLVILVGFLPSMSAFIESIVVPFAWLVLLAVMVAKRIYDSKLGKDKKMNSEFVPLSEISVSLSDNKKTLFLNNRVFIPFNQTQKVFEQLKELIKIQQEIG